MNKKHIIAALVLSVSTFSATSVFAQSTQPVATEQAATSEHTLNNYEKIMTDKVWITTEALDQDGKLVDSKNADVSNFFGLAEYYPNGSFKMLTLEGQPKMQGNWSFDKEGKTRSLTAKNDAGEVLFSRVVENVTLTPEEYTYRIYPKAEDKSKYYDIVHKVKK